MPFFVLNNQLKTMFANIRSIRSFVNLKSINSQNWLDGGIISNLWDHLKTAITETTALKMRNAVHAHERIFPVLLGNFKIICAITG